MTPRTSDHTDQLHQEQREASNHPSMSQSRGAGSTGPKATLEDTVQASAAKDKLESRMKNVLKMYRHIYTAPDTTAQYAGSYRHASGIIKKLGNMESKQAEMIDNLKQCIARDGLDYGTDYE